MRLGHYDAFMSTASVNRSDLNDTDRRDGTGGGTRVISIGNTGGSIGKLRNGLPRSRRPWLSL